MAVPIVSVPSVKIPTRTVLSPVLSSRTSSAVAVKAPAIAQSLSAVQTALHQESKTASQAVGLSFGDVQDALKVIGNTVKPGLEGVIDYGKGAFDQSIQEAQTDFFSRMKPILIIGGVLLGGLGLFIFLKKKR